MIIRQEDIYRHMSNKKDRLPGGINETAANRNNIDEESHQTPA